MPYPSQPVLWHQLITEMEVVSRSTGWGLARIWGYVHREDYTRARASFDAFVEAYYGDGARP